MGYLDSEAVCPYYRSERKGVIYCEGGTIKTKDKLMKAELGYGRCGGEWKCCQMKLALDHYYEREEKKENH